MRNSFRGKDFLTLMDYSADEINGFLDTASDLKRQWARRQAHEILRGKSIAVIFEKKSTRTRVSFQSGGDQPSRCTEFLYAT